MMTVFLDDLFLQCSAVRLSGAYHVDKQGIFVFSNLLSVSHTNRCRPKEKKNTNIIIKKKMKKKKNTNYVKVVTSLLFVWCVSLPIHDVYK